jgi:uncharacterized membrane protein
MNLRLATLLGLVLAGAAAVVSLYHWAELPDPMPTHFDPHGHPNGYSSRLVGALLMPVMIAVLSGLWVVLARISPIGFSLRRFEGTVGVVGLAIEAFLLLVHMEMLRAATTGTPFSLGIMSLGMGSLFLVLGNAMGKVRRNFFLGVRTPWTLADEEVWGRTHRLAGKLFVAAGLVVMSTSLMPTHGLGWALLVAAPLIVAGLVPVVYSYRVYRRLHPTFRL